MQTRIVEHVSLCQSPILTETLVESTQYSLRLTPSGKYGVREIEIFLEQFQEWIYSFEISKKGKEHYHMVVWTSYEEEKVREMIRLFLSQYFPGPARRGDANKQYNLSEIEDLESTVTYLLKDHGELKMSKGVNQEIIKKLQKASYKKFSKEEFAKQLEILKKRFKDESPRIGTMMEEIVKLKGMYRQPVNLNQIYQMCIGYEVHNDPSRSVYYVQEFLSRYN